MKKERKSTCGGRLLILISLDDPTIYGVNIVCFVSHSSFPLLVGTPVADAYCTAIPKASVCYRKWSAPPRSVRLLLLIIIRIAANDPTIRSQNRFLISSSSSFHLVWAAYPIFCSLF
jgi:hypothetical protein